MISVKHFMKNKYKRLAMSFLENPPRAASSMNILVFEN